MPKITDDVLIEMKDQFDGTAWFTLVSAPGAGKRIKLYEVSVANEFAGGATVVELRWGNSGVAFTKLGTPGGAGGGGGGGRINLRPGLRGPDGLALQARMRLDPGVTPPQLSVTAVYQVF